jgi:hypothetical protein
MLGHMLPGDRTEVDLSVDKHANGSAPGKIETPRRPPPPPPRRTHGRTAVIK